MTRIKNNSLGIALLCLALPLIALISIRLQARQAPQGNTIYKEYEVGAVLWVQSSAEYRALAYQVFVLARLRLDEYLQKHARPGRVRSNSPVRRNAIVVDIDETILDNSHYIADLILRGLSSDDRSWREWCERGEAEAVPGAVDFLNYAARRGVRIFYITNRRQSGLAGTMLNLHRLGFPNVSGKTVLVRLEDGPASKELRREQVATNYYVVLLIGDNLNDFNDAFAGKSTTNRAIQVDHDRGQFGTRFILLPNPIYGDWEDAIYQEVPRKSDADKQTYRHAALKGY
jgi:5'-nucleotidase (lipoprotein e(P4) family)